MVTKLEAGHWYKEPDGRTWMYIYDYEIPGEESGIRHGVMFRGQRAVTLVRPDDIDLSTLVEVCYVDGEEMIVGEEYHTDNELITESYPKNCCLVFLGVIGGKPVFDYGEEYGTKIYATYPYWKRVEPVPTYHLVKSIDGKEVSRVEVSEEKAKELEE